MSTTSLKLTEELKARAAAVASQRGLSAHAFMLDAIRAATIAAEQRAGYIADALAADAKMRKSGKGYDADAVHKYIRDKVAGRRARKPKAIVWRG